MIARALSTDGRKVTPKTAARYMQIVRERWKNRMASEDRETVKIDIIEQERESIRRCNSLYAAAMNGVGGTKPNLNVALGCVRGARESRQFLAELFGLKAEKIEHSFAGDTLDEQRQRAIEESVGEVEEDAIRILRGVVPPDSRQGGADTTASPEPAPGTDS